MLGRVTSLLTTLFKRTKQQQKQVFLDTVGITGMTIKMPLDLYTYTSCQKVFLFHVFI